MPKGNSITTFPHMENQDLPSPCFLLENMGSILNPLLQNLPLFLCNSILAYTQGFVIDQLLRKLLKSTWCSILVSICAFIFPTCLHISITHYKHIFKPQYYSCFDKHLVVGLETFGHVWLVASELWMCFRTTLQIT